MVMLFASSTWIRLDLLSFLNQEQRNVMESKGIFLLATYSLCSWEGDVTWFPMSFLELSFLTGGICWDYYQDAKEHLSALVHQLGPSLVDIEVCNWFFAYSKMSTLFVNSCLHWLHFIVSFF
jgi:hypothetical protein